MEEKFKKFIFNSELVENESICKIQTIENSQKKIVEATFLKKRNHRGGFNKHLYIFKQKNTYRTYACYINEIEEIKIS